MPHPLPPLPDPLPPLTSSVMVDLDPFGIIPIGSLLLGMNEKIISSEFGWIQWQNDCCFGDVYTNGWDLKVVVYLLRSYWGVAYCMILLDRRCFQLQFKMFNLLIFEPATAWFKGRRSTEFISILVCKHCLANSIPNCSTTTRTRIAI